MRARTSALPPGGYGTMILIDLPPCDHADSLGKAIRNERKTGSVRAKSGQPTTPEPEIPLMIRSPHSPTPRLRTGHRSGLTPDTGRGLSMSALGQKRKTECPFYRQ